MSRLPLPGLRVVLAYGCALAGGALLLRWLQFQMLLRPRPGELRLALFAIACMALGAWIAARLLRRATLPEDAAAASRRLNISERELEVLTLLAAGQSNKEIARRLAVSPNTVKSHVARLFEKLGARRRTQAILRARDLGVIR